MGRNRQAAMIVVAVLVAALAVVGVVRWRGSGVDASLLTAPVTSSASSQSSPTSTDDVYTNDDAQSDGQSDGQSGGGDPASTGSGSQSDPGSGAASGGPLSGDLDPATLPPADPNATVTIAAAGDIACNPNSAAFNDGAGTANACQQRATSDVVLGLNPNAVLLLGDDQYEDGALDAYRRSYGPSWGRVKAITHPAPGNHDYNTPGGAGYHAYFGAAAGSPGEGYYSYDLGAWHLVVLNSNCDVVSCDTGSPQETWLKADLAQHRNGCVLAYWHHPRWSHGEHGDNERVHYFVEDLYAAGAEVILNGHDHDYERFAPLNPSGAKDPAGVREFVVGTGGRSHYQTTTGPNTEAMNDRTFGVLSMTLAPGSYSWTFAPVAGSTFTDTGSGTCH